MNIYNFTKMETIKEIFLTSFKPFPEQTKWVKWYIDIETNIASYSAARIVVTSAFALISLIWWSDMSHP